METAQHLRRCGFFRNAEACQMSQCWAYNRKSRFFLPVRTIFASRQQLRRLTQTPTIEGTINIATESGSSALRRRKTAQTQGGTPGSVARTSRAFFFELLSHLCATLFKMLPWHGSDFYESRRFLRRFPISCLAICWQMDRGHRRSRWLCC